MNHEQEAANAGRAVVESEGTFGIVVVYEDSVTGLLAKDVFNGTLRALGLRRAPQWGLWRFDLLGLPKHFAQAAAVARSADAVIVAGYGHSPWPAAMGNWLHLLGDARAKPRGCFAALLVRSHLRSAETEQRRAWLGRCAARCGRQFLAEEVDLDQIFAGRLREKIPELVCSSVPVVRVALRHLLAAERGGTSLAVPGRCA